MNRRSSARSLVLDVNRYQLGKRRSVRMTLNAAVGLAGHDHQKCPFTMPAQATNLNKHGAAIQVNRELSLGSTVVVRNKYGAQVSARVVTQISAVEGGARTYGIEFVEQDEPAKNFWGITFPTA
jgi:PilZ domain-containing protein